jgi:hypothetical protein
VKNPFMTISESVFYIIFALQMVDWLFIDIFSAETDSRINMFMIGYLFLFLAARLDGIDFFPKKTT